ncbi:TPA: hypothetical protein DDZ01_03320 [Candidatus Uhrbacteria bacterium]|nr:MAG: hypothetical protein UT94_C0002G0002 [Candidatus Uhrbacteria bacterium GW2011_GWF2_40_263]OGL97411.1 MAG: hypothetical protein A2332_04815 [Candidatus Uhrbacteria bacterium RIFOXYB2_FULL_41_18]HBK34998.1 hypothetical protein [Candidatus Uhrbacteria bacterium]HCB56152.1 hypothetical protein [Candidatus Uhrbacteria bacterium]
MLEKTPCLDMIEIPGDLQTCFDTYKAAEKGAVLTEERKGYKEYLYNGVFQMLVLLSFTGCFVGALLVLVVSVVWSFIDMKSIQEHFSTFMKIGVLYLGVGGGVGVSIFGWFYSLWQLFKSKNDQRTEKEQEFIDDPIFQYVGKVMKLVEKYQRRIARWQLVAKGIDGGVLSFSNGNRREFERLQEARPEIERCLTAADFLLGWKKSGFADSDGSSFSDLLTDMRDAQAKLDALLEIDLPEELDVGMVMPSLPDLGEEELRLRRAGAVAATKAAVPH